MNVVTRQEIIERPRASLRPHVVLLGAGASRAAFPYGDASSRPIPLMHDLVETLDLQPILDLAGKFKGNDFESIYSRLAADPRHGDVKRTLERKLEDYFSALHLPEEATQKFNHSWMARWPRRSREAVFVPMSSGRPCEDFPLSLTEDLVKLQTQALEIAKWEAGEDQEAS